jgi:nicotinic acid phosphoribosyltransferase
MPRFTKEMGDCLKAKMLQRLDTMTFSEQDVQEIIREHGLNEAQISQWMRNFRFRYASKSKEEIEAYLRNEEKVRDRVLVRVT